MEHTAVNESVHTACKQHQRVCRQMSMQMCLRVLRERGLRSSHCTYRLALAERLFAHLLQLPVLLPLVLPGEGYCSSCACALGPEVPVVTWCLRLPHHVLHPDPEPGKVKPSHRGGAFGKKDANAKHVSQLPQGATCLRTIFFWGGGRGAVLSSLGRQ